LRRPASISAELGASDDIITQMLWRQVRATVLARRGEFERAEQLACKPTEAASALAQAVELYERKGNVVSAEAARARLAELQARA
jgi:hypothetical protein